MANDVVIQTRNLTKVYRDFWGRKKVRALNSLSMEVVKGEVFGLLGPNGSGKTTTLKLLLGLLFPTEGDVTILGKSASDVTKNERIGYLPEESYLYRFLNAEETLDFYGRLFNMPANVRRDRSKALIERVGLTHARRRQLKEYSKGMTRRIGLAQALINEPDLILLDEPTSGLDPIGSRDMKDMIVKLKQEGKTVVMCSHLLADVQDVCDRIAILDGGELKVFGKVQDLLKDQGVTQIKTSHLDEAAIKEVEAVLAGHGAKMLEVDHPTTSLEDLFIKTVRDSAARPGQRYVPPSTPSGPPIQLGQPGPSKPPSQPVQSGSPSTASQPSSAGSAASQPTPSSQSGQSGQSIPPGSPGTASQLGAPSPASQPAPGGPATPPGPPGASSPSRSGTAEPGSQPAVSR